LYSNLRFLASASLVALASLVGVLALFPDALEQLVVASTETPDSPATGCKQDWLRFDPSCLSRRGMPWITPSSDSNTIPSTGEDASAQPLTESSPAAVAPVQQSEAAAPQQGTPAPVAEERQSPAPTQRSEAAQQETPAPAPVAEEQHIEEQRREATAPPQEASPPPPVAEERHIPKQRREVAAPRRETPPVAEGRRRQTRGRGAAARRRPEEAGVRGSGREATACHRGVECRAKVSRQSARHSRERLCRRRDAADDRHPPDLDPGRLLLLCSSLERGCRPHHDGAAAWMARLPMSVVLRG
jgi:hypothetical protein